MRPMFSRSTPDSGSSSMTKSGDCAESCRSSDLLISPPEKPTFTSLSMKSCILNSFSRPVVPFPLAAVTFTSSPSLTPITFGGLCIIIPMPSLARWSTDMPVMSSPLKMILPEVTVVCPYPMMVDRRVDFPDPLGPKRTQVSPSSRFMVTPLRISLPPASTCRSLISRSDIGTRILGDT